MDGGIESEQGRSAAVFVVLADRPVAADKRDVLERLPVDQRKRLPGKVAADTEAADIAPGDELPLAGEIPQPAGTDDRINPVLSGIHQCRAGQCGDFGIQLRVANTGDQVEVMLVPVDPV